MFPVAIFIHWSNSLAGKQESLIIKHSTSLKKKVNYMFMLQHPQNVETSVSVISWKLRPVYIVVGENSVSHNYLTVWYAEAFLCTCLSFLDCFAKILWFSNLSELQTSFTSSEPLFEWVLQALLQPFLWSSVDMILKLYSNRVQLRFAACRPVASGRCLSLRTRSYKKWRVGD